MSGKSLRDDLRREIKEYRVCSGQISEKLPRHLNIHLFGPRGAGKSSFIRSCYKALHGPSFLPDEIGALELTTHDTVDATLKYKSYALTNAIFIHDTKGQFFYDANEKEQASLILQGLAKEDAIVKQREPFWWDFFASKERLAQQFDSSVFHTDWEKMDAGTKARLLMQRRAHFVFIVLDPHQKNDIENNLHFRDIYLKLIKQNLSLSIPFRILCTHGDVLSLESILRIITLPQRLKLRAPDAELEKTLEKLVDMVGQKDSVAPWRNDSAVIEQSQEEIDFLQKENSLKTMEEAEDIFTSQEKNIMTQMRGEEPRREDPESTYQNVMGKLHSLIPKELLHCYSFSPFGTSLKARLFQQQKKNEIKMISPSYSYTMPEKNLARLVPERVKELMTEKMNHQVTNNDLLMTKEYETGSLDDISSLNSEDENESTQEIESDIRILSVLLDAIKDGNAMLCSRS